MRSSIRPCDVFNIIKSTQDVPRHLVIVDMLDVRHLGLELVIAILNKKNAIRERFQVWILKKEILKLFIF
jgi:hypothetical protein